MLPIGSLPQRKNEAQGEHHAAPTAGDRGQWIRRVTHCVCAL